MMASFGSPLKLSPSSPKRRKEALNWEQCIICQYSNAEPVICMRDVGKDSFVRSMEIKRDEVYSLILQEISTMDNFISRKIKVVYHRNTTERCHHTEYERLCPVKFWYYNNLITNQQNTLIIDKQTTKTTPNEV
jgi:hypothetical protein